MKRGLGQEKGVGEKKGVGQEEQVARMLTDPRFYNDILHGAEWLLVLREGAVLCGNSGEGVDEWLDWDWAGAARFVLHRLSCIS